MAWHGKVRPGLLLFILYSFAVISGTAAKSLEPFRYDTAYACEGKTLKIECKEGELIKLIRANYGRFSITICNDHGNTDWSVNCMAPKSLRVLHERCTDHQNCSIPASTSMFGDPCQGTHKYLEAHYQCQPATTTTTTSRPSPPWLITSQPPMWTTVKSSAARPPPTSKTATVHQHQGGVAGVTQPRPPPSTAASLPTASAAAPPAKRPPPPVAPASDESVEEDDRDGQVERGDVDVQIGNIPDEITTLPYTTINPKKTLSSGDSGDPSQYVPSSPSWPVDPLEEHCPPVTVRGIHWNWTRVSQTSIQTCPGGTTGFARWRCSNTTIGIAWSPSTPDLSECRSVWLTSLEQRVKAGKDPLVQITNELAQVTSRKTLYGGDMMITTKIIQRMAQKMSQDIETFSDRRQREVLVTEMLNYVVKTGSNLLDPSQHPSWKDLSFKEQMRVATSLLIGLEENAFLLADTITKEKTVDQIYKNIMLSVRVLETKSVTTETFPSDNSWLASNDSVEIPKGALIENSDGELVRLVFVAFDRLEEILQWHPDVSDPSSNKSVPRILNSKVISASLGKGRHIQLREPVRLTLQHLKTENVSNPSCVFWDYTTSKWSEEGCHVAHTSYTHTICLCDHLTNFAILMDVHEIDLPIQHEIALQIITYIGCSVSIFCLALAILTFQLFRGLKSDHRVTIHCNLCICLLVAELLFLAGIEQTENRIVCGVIAGFLQYFFLCAFGWMFFEGFQLYVMLIEVFEAEKSRIRWYYGFAYGLPLFVVVLSASVYPQGYGTDKYCWLQIDNYFIYTFVVPVLIVIILNLFFLIMAIVMMCRHASATVSMKNKEHSRLASTSGKEENALQEKLQAHLTWLRGAVVLVILLGLTWTFGFLYLDKETVVMAYLFCILNSLQGFFIFLFHCVQNEKVRKEYMKFIQKHSWLPKCLRCSKLTGGPAGSSGSSGLSKDRRTNLFAGSNGNGPSSSNSHSHSTDQSVLSPHGTSNISFKSYSRDSGHGGSEQEESPRSHATLADTRLNNTAKDLRRQAYMTAEALSSGQASLQPVSYTDYIHRHVDSIPHPKHLPLSQSLQTGHRKKNSAGKPNWNQHTYTEIEEGILSRGPHPHCEDDPVYEEIERNEIQVSDMSDEDGKRQSDMSRQSSRSYGDHRPLIPYSPGTGERGLNGRYGGHVPSAADLDNVYRGMAIGMRYRGDTARSLAAVLDVDGETVVCHLEPTCPSELYQHEPQYVSRTMVLPPYSES